MSAHDCERRSASLEWREDEGQPPRLRGYAAVFNDPIVVGDVFREQIAPGAFDAAIGRDDVRLLFNHDPAMVLARTANGSLQLSVDARGLRYEATLDPQDPDVARVVPKIRDGRVTQSSFGFTVTKQEWQEARAPELPMRIVREVELFDVSPVTYPAYPRTTVTVRDASAHLLTVDEAEARQWRRRHDEES